MIYIGDSATDIPCMKLVDSLGGYSIGVYSPGKNDKTRVYTLINENRIKYFAPADYTEESQLDKLVKNIIDKTVANEILMNNYYLNKKEAEDHSSNRTDEVKNTLIRNYTDSRNFAATHTVVKIMKDVDSWTTLQLEQIYEANVKNGQIYMIINDSDIMEFLKALLQKYPLRNTNTDKIEGLFE